MFTGHVDNIEHGLIEGWAIDTDGVNEHVEVMLFIDGHHHVTITCDAPRDDLKALGGYGEGNHGFHYAFPTPLPAHREHRIFVVFKNDGTLVPNGHKLLLSMARSSLLQPILVTAPGRSGTTLLMSRLARAREVCIGELPPFELRMSSYYAAAYRVLTSRSDPIKSTNPDDIEGSGYFVGYNPFFDENFEPAFTTKEQFLETFSGVIPAALAETFRNIIQTFYARLAYDQGKTSARYFAEKTNNTELNVRQFVRSIFGGVSELVLIRDPRDIYCSHMAYFHTNEQKSFLEITEACSNLLEIYNSGSKDTLFVSYEGMIFDEEETLRKIENFLSLEIPVQTDLSHEDSIFRTHATTATPQASIARWKRDLNDDQKQRCNEAWQTFLKTFGYSDAADHGAANTRNGVSPMHRGTQS